MTGIGTVSASGSTPCPRQEGDSTGTAGSGPRSMAGAGRSEAACWELAGAPAVGAGGGGWLAACSGLPFIAARMRSSRDSGSSGRGGCFAGQRSFVAPGTRRGSAGTRLSSPMRPKPPGAALTGWRDPSTHSAAHVESLFNPNDRLLFNCATSPALDLAAAYIGRGFLLGRDHASTSEGSSPGRGPGHRAHEEAPGVAPAGPARKASNGRRLLNDRTPAVRRVNDRRATGSAEERRADGALGNNRRGSRSGRAYWGWWGGMRVAGRGLVWAGNFGKHPSFGGDGTVPFVCAVVVCGSRVRGIAVRI